MVIMGLGRISDGIATAYPEIGEEAAVDILITDRTQHSAHIGKCTLAIQSSAVIIM